MFCWRFPIYSLSLFIRCILINQCGCAAFQARWNYRDLWTDTAAWGVCRGLAPGRGRLGPSQVRRGPTPGPRGPERQVGGVGLPPNRHPPEVVVALAAHLAAFIRGSAPAPALIQPRARARRAPEGRPDPGGRRFHDRLCATRQGQLLLRVVCKCLRVPSSQDAQGRAASLAPIPCAAAATPESLRLALSPDAAARAAGSGYRHPLLSGPITGRPPRAPRARPVSATAAAASSSLPGSSPGRAVPPGASRAAPPSLSPAPSRFLLPSPATGRLEPRGHSPADANLECSEGQPRSPVGHTHWAPEERRDHNSYSELCKGPAILADA